MKSLQRHTLFVLILLCCVAGCTKTTYKNETFGCGIPVDGVDYSANGMARMTNDGKVGLAAILVFKTFSTMSVTIAMESPRGDVDPGRIRIMECERGEFVELNDPKCFTVYFVKEHEIVFSKTFAELGIDASKPWPGDFTETKLRPIFETMIRENLPKDKIQLSGDTAPGS